MKAKAGKDNIAYACIIKDAVCISRTRTNSVMYVDASCAQAFTLGSWTFVFYNPYTAVHII